MLGSHILVAPQLGTSVQISLVQLFQTTFYNSNINAATNSTLLKFKCCHLIWLMPMINIKAIKQSSNISSPLCFYANKVGCRYVKTQLNCIFYLLGWRRRRFSRCRPSSGHKNCIIKKNYTCYKSRLWCIFIVFQQDLVVCRLSKGIKYCLYAQ
jgi:hypothetical protein